MLFSSSKQLSPSQKLHQLTQHTWLLTLQSHNPISPYSPQPNPEQDLWRKPCGEVEKYLGFRMGWDLCLTDSVEISVASSTESNPRVQQKHKSFLRYKDKSDILSNISIYQPRPFSELMFRTGLLSRQMKFELHLSTVPEWRVTSKNIRINRILLPREWMLLYGNEASLIKKSSMPSRIYLCCLVTD